MNKHFNFRHISEHNTPEESKGYLLWRVSTAWRSAVEAALKPLHLTHPQFVILATLGWLTRDGDRVSQAAVGKLAGLDPNTTSQIIRGLEKKELIKRATSIIDPRAKNPLLTAQGQKILATAMPVVERVNSEFFGILKDEESQELIIMFRKLKRE